MAGVQNLSSLFPVPLKAANNLSDLASVTAALTALGLGTTAAAELARIGAAAAADLAVNTQNILYQGLLIAALRGVPTGIVDGVLDPFSSLADINTGASSGYAFSSSTGTIGATQNAGPTVSGSSTAISDSDYSTTYQKGNAFDGNLSTGWVSSLVGSASIGVAYVGQDFGVGNAKSIVALSFTSFGNTGDAFSSGLFQYADAPSGPWTTLATLSLPTGATVTQNYSLPTAGAHRCWRLLANAAASGSPGLSELAMQTAGSAVAMVLQSATLPSAVASPSAMRALVQADSTSAAFTPNTDMIVALSRDGGTTFTAGTLALVQTMPDGTIVYDTGWLSVTAQPAGNSTMTYKVTTPTQKAIVLTGVSMQVKP